MKCNNCQTPIPPSFTKALQDNSCPACGKPIMSSSLFAEFNGIKEKLSDANVDEATLVKVASLIAGKYDLVTRGTNPAGRQTAPVNKVKSRVQMQEEEIVAELMEEYPELKNMPEEERQREILALRAEADREFALSKGSDVSKGTPGTSNAELVSAMSELMPPTTPVFGELDGGRADPETALRLAKMAALRGSPELRKIRRSDG